MPRLLPLLLFACAAAPLSAQSRKEDERRPVPPTLVARPLAIAVAAFDADGDLLVSRAEYDAGVARSFAQGDSDGDGYMGLIEFTGWSQASLGSPGTLPGPFDFDRDGDDRISKGEFEALFAERRAAMDDDANGALSRSELVTAFSFQSRRGGRRGYWAEEQDPPREPRLLR